MLFPFLRELPGWLLTPTRSIIRCSPPRSREWDRAGTKRDSLRRFHILSIRESAKLRQIADNREGLVPREGRPFVLTPGQSSPITCLSPKAFIDSVLSREPAIAVFDCD